MHNGYTNSTALMHNNTTKRPESSMQNIPELRTQRSDLNKATVDFSTKKEQDVPGQESGTVNNNFLFTIPTFLIQWYSFNM
jgi:hypothetical protein